MAKRFQCDALTPLQLGEPSFDGSQGVAVRKDLRRLLQRLVLIEGNERSSRATPPRHYHMLASMEHLVQEPRQLVSQLSCRYRLRHGAYCTVACTQVGRSAHVTTLSDKGPAPGELDVVTGAFSYTGKYITRELLAMGKKVRTITGHPHRPHPFGDRVQALPYRFEDPRALASSLEGAAVLYNTYWIRFSHRRINFGHAVENSLALIDAARRAGVARFVHISITNPTPNSPLAYFRGKTAVEEALAASGLPHAIIRPTVTFGPEDVLINNIAWLLRRFPLFGIPGSGRYRLQPVFVEDLARIAVAAGQKSENLVMDAVGPEIYAFADLVRLIANEVGSRARIVHMPASMALLFARLVGSLVRDVILTRKELEGLMAEVLVSKGEPTAPTRISEWLASHSSTVGTRYASELARHYRSTQLRRRDPRQGG